MQPYFIFKNINSIDMGIVVNKLPSIIKAEKNVEKIEVLGRDGFLTQDYGTYKSTVKSVECTIKNLDNINQICAWLDGGGDVIFSNETDKIYKATIINQVSFERVIRKYHRFLVQFECQPFKYLQSQDIEITKNNTKIYNPGTHESRPHIKIYGEGDFSLSINNENIQIKGCEQYIELNSGIMECYKEVSGVFENCNNKMYGEFPTLNVGENTISWVGNISKIEITPRWRCL